MTRQFQESMDMEIYNRMIQEVQQNPKFAEYFGSSSFGAIPMQGGQ